MDDIFKKRYLLVKTTIEAFNTSINQNCRYEDLYLFEKGYRIWQTSNASFHPCMFI